MDSKSQHPKKSKPNAPAGKPKRHNDLKTLGKYEILKKLGAGGMGTVYLAKDTELRRTVALKVLAKEKAENPTLVKRFESEARTAAHLKHPNIVAVFEAGEAAGYLYIAMEYVEGIDVHDLIVKRGVIPLKRSVDILKQVVQALEHAHEQEIVHRDIKPSNLLITRDGTVKLVDMGLARSLDETSKTNITRAGTTVGTVDYMAPEQARSSKAADIRSDIYSLGCTWFHMLTGRPPFPEGNLLNKLNAHGKKPPPDPREFNEAVTEPVIAVMHRMMAKKPRDRYQTPAELLKELDNANLSREAIAEKVLAALADDEDNSSSLSQSSMTTKSGPLSLPPRMDRPSQSSDDDAEKKQWFAIDFGQLKGPAIAALFIGVLCLLGWLVSQFGSTLDGPQASLANRVSPFDQSDVSGNNDPDDESDADDPDTKSEDSPDHNETQQEASGANEKSPEILTNRDVMHAAQQSDTDRLQNPVPIASETWTLFLPSNRSNGRAGEAEALPNWIGEYAGANQPTLTVWKISENDTYRPDQPTLNGLLEKFPESGGVVELEGTGPFLLRPIEIKRQTNVVIRAAGKSVPLVVLIPGPSKVPGSLVSMSKGALTVDGIHFAVLAEQFPKSDPLKMLTVRCGDLAVLNSSFTLMGTRPERTVALAIEDLGGTSQQTLDRPSRVLLENVSTRGDTLQALTIDQSQTDFVARNCLFTAVNGPLVVLDNNRQTPDRGNEQQAAVREQIRVVRFLSTTALCNGTALVLRPGHTLNQIPTTSLHFVNSLLASVGLGSKKKTTLVSLVDWPESLVNSTGKSRFRNLSLSSHHTVFSGWRQLVKVASDSSLTVRNSSDWQDVWQTSLDEVDFPDDGWPAPSSERFDTLAPQTFDAGAGLGTSVRATDGKSPGCRTAALSVPAAIDRKRGELLARRFKAKTPNRPLRKTPSKTIRVDLSSQDLGTFLAEEDWPDRARIIVTGGENCFSSPISIKDKSIQIEFQSSEDKQLTLRPKLGTWYGETDDDAFISVENGRIDIVGGRFAFPSIKKLSHPHWVLHITNGSFRLENCYVSGPTVEGTRCQGLIRWANVRGAGQGRLRNKVRNKASTIADSFLLSAGPVLDGNINHQMLFVKDSILVSLENLFHLNLGGRDGTSAGIVDIRQSTLSANSSFFKIHSQQPSESLAEPLTFLVDHTVFAPPVPSGARAPASPSLVAASKAVLKARQIDWWGDSNAFTERLTHYLQDPASHGPQAAQQFDETWPAQWGTAQVVAPMTGPSAVGFGSKLPQPSELRPGNFALHPRSQASGAVSGGRMIGVSIGRLPTGSVRRQATAVPPPNDDRDTTPNKRRVRVKPKF